MCDWRSREITEVAKRNNGPAETGPSSFVERRKKLMLVTINVNFNLAIHLPLGWIAALYCLVR
jgi:hypothetical protein